MTRSKVNRDHCLDSLGGFEESGSLKSWVQPDVLVLLTLVAAAAACATRARILSDVGLGVAGSAIQATLWVSAYLFLGELYRRPVENKVYGRRALPRVGCALLLGLVSAAIAKELMEPLLGPFDWHDWNDFTYLRHLLAGVFGAMWCVALLPRETYKLLRTAETDAAVAPFPQLVLLLVSAAVLVSCGDLAFQFGHWSGEDNALNLVILEKAWAVNTLILFSALCLVFAVTARIGIALVVIGFIYTGWLVANLAKLQYMHLPVQPLDVVLIPELLPFLPKVFGSAVLVAGLAVFLIWIGALVGFGRLPGCRISRVRRAVTGLLSLAVLIALPVAFMAAPSSPSVKSALQHLGAPDDGHADKSRRHGVLLTFLSDLPAARIVSPPGYDPAAVAAALHKYSPGAPHVKAGERTNLIVYLVESMMDPDDLGFRFTADPIPNIRALRRTHGVSYGIAPQQFGGSANTEFEALTGMAMALLPTGSVPYKRYLWRPIPSVARTLRTVGYATMAIQADPKYYFSRERAYDLLGFDRVIWLDEDRRAERDPRGSGLVSDMAVVQALIEESRKQSPFFAFAFPTSTHYPYNSGTYKNSDLDVVDGSARDSVPEIKEYINALRVADEAIGTLIQYFRGRPDRTIIAVVGDHLPPLSERALERFLTRAAGVPTGDRDLMKRRVPLLVWANFDLPKEETELSINALPAYLLERMGIVPTRFLAVTAGVRRSIPVLGRPYSREVDGKIRKLDNLTPDQQAMLNAYQLLQYDLLFGKQYSLCSNGRLDCPEEQ
jgi:hypothetical protein